MSILPNNKRIAIIGGGTNTYISNHLSLSAPAYGSTANSLVHKFKEHPDNKMLVNLYLTRMAHPYHDKECPDTPEEVEALVDKLIADPDTRVIIFNVAMVDFKPVELTANLGITNTRQIFKDFGKYNRRISSSGSAILALTPHDKIIQKIRKERKDILLVGFKTTCGATKEEQFHKGLKLCKDASANIVFVNDVDKNRIQQLNWANYYKDNIDEYLKFHLKNSVIFLPTPPQEYLDDPIKYKTEGALKALDAMQLDNQNNGLVTPEESSYWYNTRDEALNGLVQMVLDRSHLHFTRSTVVDSETVPWNLGYTREVTRHRYVDVKGKHHSFSIPHKKTFNPNPIIPETFRIVFDWVRSQGAYKQGPTGATVGHFGIKLGPNEFLTSKRKTDFNKIEEVGLVRVITDDPDNIFGYKHFFRPHDHIITDALEECNQDELSLGQIHEEAKFKQDYAKSMVSQDKVIAFGAKPSVGGQSQRSLFETFPDLNCIVHFHCPLKTEHRTEFNTTPQFSFECGSHECIASNITGFKEYKVSNTHSIWAGHMNHHGPNIVFNSDIDPQLVINFINEHWDLSRKTDGLSLDNI